jgi:hypothetical protein
LRQGLAAVKGRFALCAQQASKTGCSWIRALARNPSRQTPFNRPLGDGQPVDARTSRYVSGSFQAFHRLLSHSTRALLSSAVTTGTQRPGAGACFRAAVRSSA